MMADFIAQCFRLVPEGTKGKTRLARFLLRPHLKGRDVTLTDRSGCLLSGRERVGAAEDFLRSLGFQTCRLQDFPGTPLTRTITTGAGMPIATPPVSFESAGKTPASAS